MLVSKKFNFILEQCEQNKLAHAFLIETNNIDSCLIDIKEIIKNINCIYKFSNDCDKECNLCKLIDNDNLPSLITIYPDGLSIKRNQIEDLISKFSLKPIYSKYNSYIIVNAELMNATTSNMILKFLEEPSEYLVGFFITNNLEQILPTIKSRCEIITVKYDCNNDIENRIQNIADIYLNEIINGDDYMVNKKIILCEDLERKDIQNIFLLLFYKYKEKLELCLQNNEDDSKVLKIIELIEKELKLLKYNVNLELILDDFVVEMRRSHE